MSPADGDTGPELVTAAPSDEALRYWDARARERGRDSVVNVDHPDGSVDLVSEAQLRVIEPALRARLRGDERTLLDLGCGSARLTGRLARTCGARGVGVDPVEAMLALAEPDPDVELRRLDGARIPLERGEADVVVTCTVLGGILDPAALVATADEIRRVLTPGGLLVLCESVADHRGHAGHWRSRSVAEYASAFAWVDLTVAGRLDDGGDPLAVLAGRSRA